MNRFFKAFVLSTAVVATMATALPAAEARDWRRHHHHHSRSNGDAVAAGVIGLAAGALIIARPTSRGAPNGTGIARTATAASMRAAAPSWAMMGCAISARPTDGRKGSLPAKRAAFERPFSTCRTPHP